jgi:phosphatidate cytidylyltransferase
MQEFLKRVAVAIFGIPLIVYLTYRGGWYWFAFILIVSTVGHWEFYRLQRNQNRHPQDVAGILTGILILIGVQTGMWLYIGPVLALGVMLILAVEMWRKELNAGVNIGVTVLGIVYIPIFLACLLYFRTYVESIMPILPAAGFKFTMTVLVSIWVADTFAYIFGSLLGRHKLFIKVSPNKSIEGAVFGFIGSVLIFLLADETGILPVGLSLSLVFGIILGIVAQIGDLVESWFKRDGAVKDSSAIFPGQGGMLDIFDGLIYSSPLILIMTYLLLG